MEQVSQAELEQLLIRELAKFEDCAGVKSIGFNRLTEPDLPNWEPNIFNFGDADKALCVEALLEILPQFYKRFELK